MNERGLWRFAGLTAGLGLLVWGYSCLHLAWRAPGLIGLLALGGTCVYAEVRSLYVPGYGGLNFGEGLYFGATLSYGAPVSAALTCLFGLAADRSKRKHPAVMLFNTGWALCTYSVVGWATAAFQPAAGLSPGNCAALLLGTLAYALVAAVLQAVCQTYMEGMPLSDTMRHQLQGMRLGAPAALLLGAFAYVLIELAPWAVVIALFPVEVFTAYVRVNQLHKELLATQGQLQANSRQAALGVLTAGVAHEINNPLAVIGSSLHMLGSQPLNPHGLLCLKMANQGLERCQSITNRMLLYSRPPDNRPSSCTLKEVLEDTLLFLASRLGKMQVHLPEGLDTLPPVSCDPGLLVQVFTNLLSNAADAGAANLHLRVDGNVWRFQDDGDGVPDAMREKIWDPFFTSKELGKGTGLGLPISLSLIQSIGGQLWLEGTNTFAVQISPGA